MNNIIIFLKLIALIVTALIVTIVGISAFIPYAIFRICKTMLYIIEKKVKALKMEVI